MAHATRTTPAMIDRVASHSLDLITGLQTPEGAYPASPTFSAYAGYCWFRDGSFIADAASAAGRTESASRFFDWCARVVERRADAIEWIVVETLAGRPPAGESMLPTRFTYAGDDGAAEWWDFQLDGYGTWLWALVAHLDRHDLAPDRYLRAVALTVEYLLVSWRRPCYDWWEEHPRDVHVSTVACIVAGLEAVAGLVDERIAGRIAHETAAARRLLETEGAADGHLVKRWGDDALDGSLAAVIAPLGVVPAGSELAVRTIAAIESHLTVGGGVHRYLGDTFYGGGRWPILSCFLGLAHLAAGDDTRAGELLDWAVGTASPTLDLPEQVDGHLIAPGMRQEWVDRWGEVAEPLLWSHAMVLRLSLALGRVDAGSLATASGLPR